MLQYIPEYYEFQNSAKLLSGERALEHIPYELSVRGCKRPMLLSDRVLEKFGAVATGNRRHVPGGGHPRPPASWIFRRTPPWRWLTRPPGSSGRRAATPSSPWAAGSVLDTAKGVSMLVSHGADDLMELMGCESMDQGSRGALCGHPHHRRDRQ